MPFIFAPSATSAAPHWNWHWATLCGPDAQDFLHRVTSADVRNLPVGQGTRGCFLNPQGKLRAYFHLWRYGNEDFGLEFDGGAGGKWRDSLFGAIDQYTFAEKMSLTPVTALECRWIFPSDEAEESLLDGIQPNETRIAGERPEFPEFRDEEVRLCHQGALDFGRPWITAWGRPARLSQWLDHISGEERGPETVTPETLELWRIRSLRPRIDYELTENTVPLEAGLVDAIAASKGCYPGQEVIEKIVSLGSPAKRLAFIEGQGPVPRCPTPLLNAAEPGAEVGNLTSVTPSPDRTNWIALGFVRKNYAKEGLDVRVEGEGQSSHGIIRRIAAYA